MQQKQLCSLVFSLLVATSFIVPAIPYSGGRIAFAEPSPQDTALLKIQDEERELEDQMPKHLPIKIKIKKEKEFKDLENEFWARDFVLEVTNIGDKPIYCLSLNLWSDIKTASGQFLVFGLHFGQDEFGDIRVKAKRDDISIKPGETYGLTIHPGQLQAWELPSHEEDRQHLRKLRARFGMISFGDGSGYAGTNGVALPRNQTKL